MIPIAIYHCNISIVSRGKGKSAVAAAAYRSGEKLTNEWDGMTHDYTRKGGVVHNEIMLPPHAPPSFSDRSTLWNSVELYEKAGNAQLAREIDAALPIELSREEQIRLVREYCSSQFVSKGMCVDFAIHDTDSGNPHCHIMLTMRPLDERGAWAAKSKKEYDLDENGERMSNRLLPYDIIIKAHEGDPIAIQAVLDRYAGYIRYFSKMNGYYNSDMEDYIRTKLIESLFKFRLDR